jgi:hypothetical protein
MCSSVVRLEFITGVLQSLEKLSLEQTTIILYHSQEPSVYCGINPYYETFILTT